MSAFSELRKVRPKSAPVPRWAERVLGHDSAGLKLVSPKPQTNPGAKKKGNKMKKKELRKALEVLDKPTTKAPMSMDVAASMMKNAADVAEANGDYAKADGIRQELLITKMQVAERRRQRTGERTRFGPNSAQLFKSGLETLPDDRDVKYI